MSATAPPEASTPLPPAWTLAAIAAACGLRTWQADDLEGLKRSLDEAANAPGPGFIHMKIAPGNAAVPLLLDDPVTLGYRFTRWLSTATGG
jgi:thiamine pyrophosphate-dependent acetolactate synthase large subunit-like protein